MKPGLFLQVLGFCYIRTGSLANADAWFTGQAFAGSCQVDTFVAKVGAQADIGGYSLAIRDTASSSLSDETVREMRK